MKKLFLKIFKTMHARAVAFYRLYRIEKIRNRKTPHFPQIRIISKKVDAEGRHLVFYSTKEQKKNGSYKVIQNKLNVSIPEYEQLASGGIMSLFPRAVYPDVLTEKRILPHYEVVEDVVSIEEFNERIETLRQESQEKLQIITV